MKFSRALSMVSPVRFGVMLIAAALCWSGCETDESALLPYAGGPDMSAITIEQNTFKPRITWLGGYASVLGVNRDSVAILDSTLVWLVRVPGDQLRYPVQFGQLPSGAEDLTEQYGGTSSSQLTEDATYTFWVLKEDVWAQLSQRAGKPFVPNRSATGPPIVEQGDTIYVTPASHTQLSNRLDVYVNISDLKLFGRLADIFVEQSDTSNRPTVRWTIKQSGVTDSLVAAIGVCMGGQYNIDKVAWEMVSKVGVGPDTIYFKHNVIQGPMQMGDVSPNTFVSVPFIELLRGQDYYIWMANKDWDGEYRLRSTNYYAFATFKVW